MSKYEEDELEEYHTHLKYSKRHHYDEWDNIVNSEEVLLDPLDGIPYSFIANSPEDVLKFVYRFTDIEAFERYLIEPIEGGLIFNEVSPEEELVFLPERHYTSVSFNEFSPEDASLETCFYPEQIFNQLHPKHVKVKKNIEYPCAIQWTGNDSFDRAGESKIRLCTIIPLKRTHFIQVS
jgi:hypothetical protein